jgi:hypothetical protein
MVARRKGHHAALPLLTAQLQKAVGRAPQLEGPAGLKTFAFEPDANPIDLAFDERRPFDQAGDPFSGFDNVITRDLGIIC